MDIVSTSGIFSPRKPIFEQPCFAHVLQSACKAGVLDVTSEERNERREGCYSIELIRSKFAKCITWTKKSGREVSS